MCMYIPSVCLVVLLIDSDPDILVQWKVFEFYISSYKYAERPPSKTTQTQLLHLSFAIG